MDGMSALQEFSAQFRHKNAGGFQFFQRRAETIEIVPIGKNDQIGVAARLNSAAP
jgi:hypothetical protein